MPIAVKVDAIIFNATPNGCHVIFETPQDVKRFIDTLQQAIKIKNQRLEFFDDGIYLDGKRLDIKGLAERFLRQFESADIVSEYDLACNVWFDSLASRDAIYQVCDRIRRKTGIWIERDGVMYRIHRPK